MKYYTSNQEIRKFCLYSNIVPLSETSILKTDHITNVVTESIDNELKLNLDKEVEVQIDLLKDLYELRCEQNLIIQKFGVLVKVLNDEICQRILEFSVDYNESEFDEVKDEYGKYNVIRRLVFYSGVFYHGTSFKSKKLSSFDLSKQFNRLPTEIIALIMEFTCVSFIYLIIIGWLGFKYFI